MRSFDYLHDARPDTLRRILAVRVPKRLYSPLCALLCAWALLAGAWTIELHRLSEARALAHAAQTRYEASRRALERTEISYRRVQRLVALDERVRRIEGSGDRDARRLVAIGNRLPAHAWLTSIAERNDGIALDGRADALDTVASAVVDLAAGNGLPAARLVGVERSVDAAGVFIYHVRLSGGNP